MQTSPIQLTDVIYNAATQSFEALVTVHDNDVSRKYACAINAPITMSFQDAAKGLTTQALRRHNARGGVYSEMQFSAPVQRAGRRRFDPIRWLENLVQLPGGKNRHAA
ncbi:MAG: orotidine 5-phosphate decarboxylase [Sulfitobacter sp.]